ncbi:MAG: hypothetical protein IKR73_10200 [Oscillospiraceae bacterium]|nr:hypothetical protein [Oscillospiraceae bacterium]
MHRIRFHLPDMWYHGKLNLRLIDMIKEHPEYFRQGVEIASVYGCFPPAIWNGGRNVNGFADEETIKLVLDEFNSRGVPCRFTFTNPLLEEKHMSDPFCNRLCQIADNGFNECIVNTQVMEDHLRKNYPNYKLTSSTCKQIRDFDSLIAELDKDYSLVVLDYNFNNDFELLERIPEKYRKRIEVLICPYCYPNCKRRGEHYRFLGEQQIRLSTLNSFKGMAGVGAGGMNYISEKQFPCEAISLNFTQTTKFSTHVPPENVYGRYAELGYEHFKIEGRTMHPLNVIESFVYYMCRPEYKDHVRLELGMYYFQMQG